MFWIDKHADWCESFLEHFSHYIIHIPYPSLVFTLNKKHMMTSKFKFMSTDQISKIKDKGFQLISKWCCKYFYETQSVKPAVNRNHPISPWRTESLEHGARHAAIWSGPVWRGAEAEGQLHCSRAGRVRGGGDSWLSPGYGPSRPGSHSGVTLSFLFYYLIPKLLHSS